MKRLSLLLLALLTPAALLVAPSATATAAPPSPTSYLRADPIHRAIVVLGAKLNPDGSAPAILSSRLATAARLAKASPMSPVVVSGGRTQSRAPLAEAQYMHLALTAVHGIAPWRVVRDDISGSTAENAQRTTALMKGRGYRGAVVVTQGWHMQRVLGDFRSAAPGLRFVPGYAR